jgi:hypothetical protein
MKTLSCYVHTDRGMDTATQTDADQECKHTYKQEQQWNVMITKEPYYCRLHQHYIGMQG